MTKNTTKWVVTALIIILAGLFVFSACEIVPTIEHPHDNPVDPDNPDNTDNDPVYHTVTFESNGGNDIDPVTVEHGSVISAPDTPVKDGAVFSGWYEDSALTDLWVFGSDVVTDDMTLHAKWTANVPDAPGSPLSPDLSVSGSGSVSLSWTEVPNTDSYRIFYHTANDSSSASVIENITDTSATVTGLDDDVFYYFWLSAVNDGGESGLSPVNRCAPVASGTDHAGEDLIISGSQSLSGVHYNIGTFRIESGITLSVDSYIAGDDTTGFLTVYAETIEIDGTIDANGAGYGGGGGGGGGAGGSHISGPTGSGASGGSSVQGSSSGSSGDNASGTNSINGGRGGNGGNGAGPGAGSAGDGGNGGGGGSTSADGTPGSDGNNGNSAAYSASGATAGNEVIDMGSGGGAGGNGGGAVRLYSFGNLAVTGSLLAAGDGGGSGGGIPSGYQSGGTGGTASGSKNGSQGGTHGGGQEAGGHQAANGGSGSGGGILLKGVDVDLNNRPISVSSPAGSSSYGEIKIFYEISYEEGAYTGTSYVNQLGS